ncbi:MAG: amidohydrolase, partial [Acidobacteriia bacterium]|nr:amidohydrolase [Terriglobia bacterium]
MFFLLLLSLSAQVALCADLILHNGKIVTVDARFSTAESVAITGNRITAVGSSRAILAAHRRPGVKLMDLQGRTVLPGLTDSHVHPLGAGLSELRGKLPPLNSFAAVQAFIRAKAAATPAGQWIVVPRTFPTRLQEMRMPTREVLDVVDTHPVMFDASYVWIVNSRALRDSGITRDTPNPAGGEIVRDASGEPNGILRNAGRLLKGLNRAENFTGPEKLLALEQMLSRYLDAGLTSISDRAVTSDDIALYETLLAQGKLPLRAVLTWRLDASGPVEEVVARLKASSYRYGKGSDPGRLKFGAFKVTLDGGMTIGTAYQRMPYGDFGKQLYGMTNPDFRGQIFLSPAKLLAIMETARNLGWPLTAHAQGGGAIDALLDCFEALNKTKAIAPTRSHLMHASFQSPEAIDRLAKLGLPADVQPAWLYLDGPALSKVFPNSGMRYFFPLQTYRAKGIVLAGGSDHMIGHDRNSATNPYNPFLGIWTAVTRKMTDGGVLHAEERISRADAIRMYTLWGAYMQHAEGERGSIEKGKLADLVVLDRDILTVPVDEIRNLQPVAVILDGQIVRGGNGLAASRDGWKTVQPILQTRCAGCHQKGEIAPMAFTTYQEVRPWAKAIRAAVASRTMPPWHAARGSHVFRNDRSLSVSESAALIGWVDAGAPGPASAEVPPPAAVRKAGWKLGQPDRVVRVPGYQVAASGQLPYTFLIVPLHFEKDTWIRAAEF